MFKSARLKLTGWYLLIIMSVSLAFSAFIYTAVSRELDRFAENQRFRFERRIYIQFPDVWQFTEPSFDEELITEAKRHLLYNLLGINATIFIVSGILGYYLAGRTLEPIQEMMDQQYRFISDASHELKTPITSMRTNLEVNLREKKVSTKDAKQILSDNLTEVIDLQHLSETLLELSSNGKILDIKSVKVGDVIDSAVREVKPLAVAKNIKFQVSGSLEIEVKADSLALKRALVAVLDNAIKYSGEGKKIVVSVKKSRNLLNITVMDYGVGINASDLPHLTKRFYRSDKSRSTDGHGLGLAIVDKIIKAHKGKLSISSKVGIGTTVTLSLPVSETVQKKGLK